MAIFDKFKFNRRYKKGRAVRWFFAKMAYRVEHSPILKIIVRVNQCLPIVALSIASVACYFAFQGFQKSMADKKTDAWRLLLSASGKKVNFGQVAAIEKLHEEDAASFARVELVNTMLRGSHLNGADFNGANLTGTDMAESSLQRVNFNNADLRGVDLTKADLTATEFNGADLSGATLKSATVDIRIIYAKSISDANITGAKFVYGDNDEDGESWAAFSDTMGEDGNRDSWKNIIAKACVEKAGPPPDFGLLKDELSTPKRICRSSSKRPRT